MHAGRPFVRPSQLELLDRRTGAITRPLRHPDLALAAPAWSPDSGRLLVCDARNASYRVVSVAVATSRVRPLATGACYPGYVAGRPVYRLLDQTVVAGGRPVADIGTLTRELGRAVDQIPGLAARGGTLAVPVTTNTAPGQEPPETTVLLLDGAGRTVGVWPTGAVGQDVRLLGSGLVAERADDRLLVLDRDGATLERIAGEPILAAAASPDGRWLALATPTRIVVAGARDGRARFSLPVRTGWIAWTAR
jgi:hypothetical protein